MNKLLYIVLLLALPLCLLAQDETFPTNGVKDQRSGHFAFTKATVHQDSGNVMENATLVIKDGKVVSISAGAKAPVGAVEVDCEGKHIYPAFIELYSGYGLPEAKKGERPRGPQITSNKKGAYGWNQAIKPEVDAYSQFTVNAEKAKELRGRGFGAVLTHVQDGIARGSAALVNLSQEKENKVLIKNQAAAYYSFSKGTSFQRYPSSRMGSIALLRQTYLDAKWYGDGSGKELNLSLQSWNDLQSLPQIIKVNDRLDILRADKVGDEFGKQFIIMGSGDEFLRLNEIKMTNAPLIVPVNFPEAYKVESPLDAHYIGYKELKEWELAPGNCAALEQAGISFALTNNGVKKSEDWWKNIKKAVKRGWSKESALAALTSQPAQMLGMSNEIGSLSSGKLANFIICSEDIFEKGELLENWTGGKRFIIKKKDTRNFEGAYDLVFDSDRRKYLVEISGDPGKQKMEMVIDDSTRVPMTFKADEQHISMYYVSNSKSERINLSGIISDDLWSGKGLNGSGEWVGWSMGNKRAIEKKKEEDQKEGDKEKDEKTADNKENNDEKDGKDNKDEKEETEVFGDIIYPFNAYGWKKMPEQKSVLIKNATVWTNGDDGILEEADVLIKNGKISAVGKSLGGGADEEIDGTGKHVTCGIIDEHSHIAINAGVNEGSQASSAEVRIGDVINSEDVNMYRQLGAGVTTAQLLHGSANPIGGQSALIKFRWGSSPEELKFEGADGFIKFALGENVKQSNWGEDYSIRFPQTRMGVEQVYIDHFTRAKEYAQNSSPSKRKDLELEALSEIINKKRFITCHSYVQSEINMLMKVAEQFNFNINTFTHILEGYKVADKMKEHGANASTFSDWWMYKFEVNDAIPHNAAILNEMGIVTAINSDDAEMARRLNTETAKAVKYGGMSEEDAWKMVTLNPAKILHIDDRVGSLTSGKDADVVVWSGHPLSTYSKVEKTFVDGRKYFDLEEDEKMRKEMRVERNRIVQKMLGAAKSGEKTQAPKMERQQEYHCDDMESHEHEAHEHEENHGESHGESHNENH